MKPRTAVWWLHPVLLFVGLNGGLALVTLLTPDSVFADLWFTPKFFNVTAMAWTVNSIAAFAVGALLPEIHFRGWSRPRQETEEAPLPSGTLLVLYRVALALALFGYIVWAGIAISHGMNWQIVMDVLTGKPGAAYGIRNEYLINVGGITTCTQFGVAAVVLGSLIVAQSGWRKISGSLSLLFALAVVRAFLNTERLAVLELVICMVPVIVTRVLSPQASRRPLLRHAIAWMPLGGIGGLLGIFAGFEYGRSWTTYYSTGGQSFWMFALYRLTGYYVTALNNSAFLLARLPTPGVPFFTLNFLWHFPFLEKLMTALFPTFNLLETYFETLNTGANAEFNNGGGLLSPSIDFGPYGVVMFWLISGVISGWVYREFKLEKAWGLCLYPILFLGLLEVPRGLYLSGGRAVPPICFLLLSAYLLTVQQRHAASAAHDAEVSYDKSPSQDIPFR